MKGLGFRFQPRPGPRPPSFLFLHSLPPSFPPLPLSPLPAAVPHDYTSQRALRAPSRSPRLAPAAAPAGSCSSVPLRRGRSSAGRPRAARAAPGMAEAAPWGVSGGRAVGRALRGGGGSGAAVSCGAGSRRAACRGACGLLLGCECCRAKRSVPAAGLRNNLVFFASRLLGIVSNCPRMCLQRLRNDLRPLLPVLLPCGCCWLLLRAPSRYKWKPERS